LGGNSWCCGDDLAFRFMHCHGDHLYLCHCDLSSRPYTYTAPPSAGMSVQPRRYRW
jgi:hypothetical protein